MASGLFSLKDSKSGVCTLKPVELEQSNLILENPALFSEV